MPGTDLSKQNNSSSLPHWNCDLAYIGETFISYRETQNHPAWPHHQPAVPPACAGKAHPFQAGPALALLVLFSRHFCALHSQKVLSPGGDETVGISIVFKYVLQNVYKEI